ncbi:MAG TPA: TIM barrel protein [Cellulomonas sp.]
MPTHPVAVPPQRRFGFSVSVGWQFTELPLLDRFARVADAGFHAAECFWPTCDAADLRRASRDAGVDVVLFNMDEGDYAAGERGFACDPAGRDRWRAALDRALRLAEQLSCPRVNVLAGSIPECRSRAVALDCFVANLRWAAPRAADAGVVLVIEPLNHLTHPRYLFQRTAPTIEALGMIDHPAVGLQYDVYHAQRSEGNLLDTLHRNRRLIGHVQFADVPSRQAPGTGEVNFAAVLALLAADGYAGYVGLEYAAAPGGADPFAWLARSDRALV